MDETPATGVSRSVLSDTSDPWLIFWLLSLSAFCIGAVFVPVLPLAATAFDCMGDRFQPCQRKPSLGVVAAVSWGFAAMVAIAVAFVARRTSSFRTGVISALTALLVVVGFEAGFEWWISGTFL